MITLKFLGTWLKITGLAALALVLEAVFLHTFGWRLVAALATVLAYIGLTAAIWREWRSVRRGEGAYSYQYIHYTRDE